jgi:hypothetical protein
MKLRIDNDKIVTKINVVECVDPVTNDEKLVVFRPHILRKQLDICKQLLESLQTEETDATGNLANILAVRKMRLELEIKDIEALLAAESTEFTATWRRPSYKDLADIERRSMIEDALGGQQWDAYSNTIAKYDILLIDWNVTDDNGVIPKNAVMTVHPDIIEAFAQELDDRLNSYKLESKKSES